MKALPFVVALTLAIGLAAQESVPTREQLAAGLTKKTEALADLIAEALQKNPAVAAARARWEAARQKIPQATAWDDPMLMLGGFAPTSKGFSARDEGDFSYGLQQTIPFPGKKRLAGTVAEKEAAKSYEDYLAAAQEVVMGVRQTYADLAFLNKQIRVNQDLRAWLESAEQSAAARVAANRAILSDATLAQVERATLENDVAVLQDHRGDFVTTLNRLLNRPLDTKFPETALPNEVEYSDEESDALNTLIVTNRPALRALEREMERAKAAVALARRERAPDFTVGVSGRNYSGDGDLREAMFTLGVTLPWFNDRKYRAKIAEEQANLKSAEADLADLRKRTTEELHHLMTRLTVAHRTMLLYERTILPRLVASSASDLAAYQNGQLDFIRVLNDYRERRKAELARAEALADALKAQAELDALIGAPLPLNAATKGKTK